MTASHPYCPDVNSLVALMRWRAVNQPDQLGYTFLEGGEQPVDRTWSQLDLRVRAIAAWLQNNERPGARVLLMFEEGHAYLEALYACMYAKQLAVPVHPPDPNRLHRTLPRLLSICGDAGVTIVLTTSPIAKAARPALADDPTLGKATWLAVDTLDNSGAQAWIDPEVQRSDLAYLQYTSGSTSTPKGVMINHHNLLHQLADFDTGYDHHPDSVLVSWLPATHDLGLVYGRFMAPFIGFRCVFMSPVSFMQRPQRWLDAIHTYRGTHSPSPNFGFEVVAHKTTPESRAHLDLSSLRVVLNGAEPIRQTSEALFIEALTPHGLPPAAVTHAMGMSEATAKIITEPIDRFPARFVHLDPDAYEDNRVVLVPQGTLNARTVASNGTTVLDTRVEIVDPTTKAKLGSDEVGEMWVFGTTVAQGYFNNPEATEQGFKAKTSDGDGPFMRTGDLAFIHDGEVYLTGRLKDVIIIRGQNHHPQDVEWTLQEACPALRPNCAAAFGVRHEDVEKLVVVSEVYPNRLGDPQTEFSKMRQAIFDEHGLQPLALVLLPPRALPKTSSGKIQRTRARQMFSKGQFDPVARWDAPKATATSQRPAPPKADLRDKLLATRGRRRARLLSDHIQALTATLLGLDPEDIETDRPFGELGLDSVTAVEMVETVGTALSAQLSGTALFDHPTIDDLAQWLVDDVLSQTPAAEPASAEHAAATMLADLDEI
jgi:myxalamid-type polyketide synthase MxaE and MxaD